MEHENFERSLRAFVKRKPFEAFWIRFVDGSAVSVDHPEAVAMRGGVAVYFSPAGEITLLDHRGVSQLTNSTNAASA